MSHTPRVPQAEQAVLYTADVRARDRLRARSDGARCHNSWTPRSRRAGGPRDRQEPGGAAGTPTARPTTARLPTIRTPRT
eukprot:15058968-Alexandrium_andersonii.AAC.1